MNTEQELHKVSNIVEDLLRKDERCRNDDKYLTFKVMQHFTKIYIPFEDFKKIPAFESIKRCRAKIQNTEKRYLPTDPEVIKKRKSRAREFKKWAVD